MSANINSIAPQQVRPQDAGAQGVDSAGKDARVGAPAPSGSPETTPVSLDFMARAASTGQTRADAAAQRRALPEGDQREANAERLSGQIAELEALRPLVGDNAYAVAKAANAFDNLQAGQISASEALSELRECRSLVALDASAQQTIDALEREVVSSPARELSALARQSGQPGIALAFQNLSSTFNQAMDALRLNPSPEAARGAFQALMDAHGSVLSQDGLFNGLPPQEANEARTQLSQSFQTLLQAAQIRMDLAPKAEQAASKVAMANAMARGAELASGPCYDQAAFKDLLLDAAADFEGGKYLSGIEDVLSQDPLTDRMALDLLHDLQSRLATDGVIDSSLAQTVSNLRGEAVEAQGSQFTNLAADPALLDLRPPKDEVDVFLDRAIDIAIRLGLKEDDEDAWADLRLLANDMELFAVSQGDYQLDQEAVNTAVGLRQLKAEWAESSKTTDDLAAASREAQSKLSTLPEGPVKRRLAAEAAGFESFRLSVEEGLVRELEGRLGEARDLLDQPPALAFSGGKTGEAVNELEARLDGALQRVQGDPKAGAALKADEAARTQEAKNLLEMRLLAERQESLRSSRAGTGSLEDLAQRHGSTAEGREMMAAFSKDRAAELKNEIAALAAPESAFPGEAVKAQLAGIERRVERLLLKGDAAEVKAALAEKREGLMAAMGEKAVESLEPAILGQLSDTERQGLKTVLGHTMGAETLTALVNASPKDQGLALVKGLAALAEAPASEIPGSVDALLLDQPRLDDIALDLKLGLTPAAESESVSAAHNGARLQRQTFALIKENGGQDLLDSLGAAKPGDLDFNTLTGLLGHAVSRSGGTPAFEGGAFNTLLVQTAWSRFLQEGNLSGSDADLSAFRGLLPEPLSRSSPEVLKGLFALGPLSGADMSSAVKMAASGSKLLARQDVGRLMDRLADHDPGLKARRALTVMLRNMLVSASIEFNPDDDSVGAYSKALQAAIPKRAAESSLTDRATDALKRTIGLLSEASRLDYGQQLDAALSRVQGLTGPIERVRRLETELALATKELQTAVDALKPTEAQWAELNFQPGEKLPEAEKDPEARVAKLADPFRFLRHQDALKIDSKTIDGAKIEGEGLAMTVLALKDTLGGAVKGLQTPAQRLEALKSLDFPTRVNFKRMISDSFRHGPEDEAKEFLKNIDALKALDPSQPDFEAKFEELSNAIVSDIEKYGLERKSELILAFKDTRESLRVRESTGATVDSAVQDARVFGDSPKDAAGNFLTDATFGSVTGLKAVKAARVGLSKIDKAKGPVTGPAKAIREHLLERASAIRGRGANLDQAMSLAALDARAKVTQTKALLEEALSDLSTRTAQALQEACRMSTLAAFGDLGFHDFAEAAGELRPEAGQSRFRAAIEDRLVKDFGIDKKMASLLVESNVVQPIAIERASRGGGEDSPKVLERFCAEAVPSERVESLQDQIDSQLAAPVRQLVDSEANRRRFSVILDHLDPGAAIDFSAGASASALVGVETGVAGISASLSVAMEKGISLGRDAGGAFELAIRGDFKGGFGGSASVLSGAVEASLGLSANASQCLKLTFKSKDDAAAFLQKLSDGAFSPEDLLEHCQNVKTEGAVSAGAAATVKAQLGEVKVFDNFPIGTQVVSAGFEASGNLARKTETDASAQTVSTTTAVRGRLAVTLNVAKAEEEEDDEDDGGIGLGDETPDFGASDAMEAAGVQGVEVGDGGPLAIFGKNVVVAAGASKEDGGFKLEASVMAARSSTVTRSTRGDDRGRLAGASQDISLEFAGRYAESQLASYADKNLNLSPSVIESMRGDVQANGTPFTLEVSRSLKPEVAERCRHLEATPGSNKEVKALLRDESNYETSSVKLVFQGRQESESHGVTINTGLVRFEARQDAKAAETISVEYQADLSAEGL